MIIRFEKTQIYVLSGVLLALSGLFLYLYMTMYKPVQQTALRQRAELQTAEKALAIQKNQFHAEDGIEQKSATELQKLIPSEPLIEQFILDIEKAEVKSNSLVQQMTFGASAEATGDSSSALEQYDEMDKGYGSSGELEEEVAGSEKQPINMPEGLQKETIQLSVESPTYFDLEMFLATLQGGKRYVEVENLTFTGPAEKVLLEELKTDKLTYTLDVSVYYHTGIQELKKNLPELETPPPGNKQHPFSNY